MFEVYTSNGVKVISNEDCVSKMNSFNEAFKHVDYQNIINSAPIFYPSNFTLGFMGALANRSYSIMPGHYNFVEILKLIEAQKSSMFICEDNLLNVDLAKNKLNDVKRITKLIKDVVVFTSESSLKDKNINNFKELFDSSKIHFYDDLTFNKI